MKSQRKSGPIQIHTGLARGLSGAGVIPFARDALAAASRQPEHSEQIKNPSAQPTEKSILGLAMPSRAVIDQFLTNLPARPLDQGRPKAVHRGKIWQFAKSIGPDQFPPAASIRCIIPQHEATHPVRDPRLQPFEAAIISTIALAGYQTKRCRVLVRNQARPQACSVIDIILISAQS
jgi:hypothetical protein